MNALDRLKGHLWKMIVVKHDFRAPSFHILRRRKYFLTWHYRPKRAAQVFVGRNDSTTLGDHNRVGIVMQGPIVRKDNFTLETLRLYRKLFGEAPIVLSTWIGEVDRELAGQLEELKIEVRLSTPPEIAGPSNFNFQVKSTLEGLKLIESLGVGYAVKTRSDQRIYSQNALTALLSLQRNFPAKNGGGRVIAVSLDTFFERPFGLSDMLQFGHLRDLQSFWSVPLARSDAPTSWIRRGYVNESYLAYNYALRHSTYDFSFDGWLAALRDIFCVVDAGSLDLFWRKYSDREYLWRRYNTQSFTEVTFVDWLSVIAPIVHPNGIDRRNGCVKSQ